MIQIKNTITLEYESMTISIERCIYPQQPSRVHTDTFVISSKGRLLDPIDPATRCVIKSLKQSNDYAIACNTFTVMRRAAQHYMHN